MMVIAFGFLFGSEGQGSTLRELGNKQGEAGEDANSFKSSHHFDTVYEASTLAGWISHFGWDSALVK